MFAVFHYSQVVRYFVVGRTHRLGKVYFFKIARCALGLIVYFKIWQRNLHVIYIFKVSALIIYCYWNPDDLLRSNDYSYNECKSSLKAILLNKVVVGKGCKLLHDDATLTAPPAGYNSVGKFNTQSFDFGPDAAKTVVGPWRKRKKLES
jgi:hypothetical protein